MPLKLTLAGILEIGYAVITRTWLPNQVDDMVALEISTTCFRVVTIACYWLLFRDVIRGGPALPGVQRSALFWGGVAAILLVPVLVGSWGLPGLPTKIVFGLTSVVVAIREEMFYRGVIQNLLERRLHWLVAIVISNVLFTVYHYGAFSAGPFTPQSMLGYFAVGGALGLVYLGTGSLALPIAIHAAEDVLWCFTPLLANPWTSDWRTLFELLGLLALVVWVKRSSLIATLRNEWAGSASRSTPARRPSTRRSEDS